MDRARLWEITCQARDAVLWTSFTPRELLHEADRIGYPLGTPAAGPAHDPALATMAALHQACDEQNPFSERVDELLHDAHVESVRRIRTSSPEEVVSWLGRELCRIPVRLSGLVWSVVTDPRPCMRGAERGLLWRLSVEGLRAVAFGKVELLVV